MARKFGAEDIAEPRQPAGGAWQRRGKAHWRALLAGKREGDIGPAHGKPTHHLAHGFGLGAVELEELQPRRRGIKQVADLDARAGAERRRFDVRFHAGIDFDAPGVRLGGVPRRDRQPRHGADRRQRLAAEPERADRDQIVIGKLRGGMALDRKHQVGARHALAVIGHADETAAAAVGEHVDAARAGVERIFHKFLDDARRALDDLARGNAVDGGFGKLADGHEQLDE